MDGRIGTFVDDIFESLHILILLFIVDLFNSNVNIRNVVIQFPVSFRPCTR